MVPSNTPLLLSATDDRTRATGFYRIASLAATAAPDQITHLITRTNMFRAVEAGAAVSNMISAYGGIRWGTGMSRAFQYEKSQSRIGAPPWEAPLQRYSRPSERQLQ